MDTDNGNKPVVLHQPFYDVSLPVVLPYSRVVNLELAGQGSVSYNIRKSHGSRNVVKIKLTDGQKPKSTTLLKLVISDRDVNLIEKQPEKNFKKQLVKPFHFKLVNFEATSRYLWVSVDKNHKSIKFGIGYMMAINTLYIFEPIDGREFEADKIIRKIASIMLKGGNLHSQPKYWRLPIVKDPPAAILHRDLITMAQFEQNAAMPAIQLPIEAQRLYESVAGAQISISADQAAAINYSLDTPGCCLYEKLKEKSFGVDSKSSYIRATIGANRGDSTGVPFVFEIWPKDHHSPIHNHGDTVAIVKVLHGAIMCYWYNPLPEDSEELPQQFLQTDFHKGDITWMTPEYYQTHKLWNYLQDTMTATIQCYGYLGSDINHVETFNYVLDNNNHDYKLHRFVPKSDFAFGDMLRLVQAEYSERPTQKRGLFSL